MVINYLKKFLQNNLYLFLICLFLIKVPPFYIFPPIKNGFLTTHTFARLIIVILFLKQIFINKKSFFYKRKPVIIFFLIYFGFVSLSIISTVNIKDYLLRYKDIVFPGLFMFLTLLFKNKKNAIIKIFFYAAIVNFCYQMLIFINPGAFTSFASFFVYSNHLELVLINIGRARIFIETYDEIVIPFVFFYLIKSKNDREKVFLYLILIFISLPSFLSNFRSRILMLFFSFIASFFFLTKKKFSQKFLIFIFLIFIGYFSYVILNYNFNFSFIDRFALTDKREDVNTIRYRWNNIIMSEEMAQSQPLFGVGLGNYYDNLPPEKKNFLSLSNWQNKEAQIASTNPHNIFAQILSELGFLSLLFYLIMISYFAISDIKILLTQNNFTKAIIISFWSLFIFSLFNPTTTLTYNSLFWILRALI